MSEGRFESDNEDYDQFLPPAEVDDQSEEERLLNEVLEQTMAAVSGDDAWQLVCDVARRASNTVTLELATVEELVSEIIAKYFRLAGMPDGTIRHVAEMLLEDPSANDRLQALWQRARDNDR